MISKKVIGQSGEEFASVYLKKQGYKILDRNFRTRNGEIDIIAKDTDVIVFVEVKTRFSAAYGSPEEAITPRKLAFIERAAGYYCARHSLFNAPLRIDAIVLQLTKHCQLARLEHFKNVWG